jgi:hypothetical protein
MLLIGVIILGVVVGVIALRSIRSGSSVVQVWEHLNKMVQVWKTRITRVEISESEECVGGKYYEARVLVKG